MCNNCIVEINGRDFVFCHDRSGLVIKVDYASIAGGIVGGVWMVKIGINRALWYFGVVQLLSIVGFVVLSRAGNVGWVLFVVVSFEYLGVGLGTAAFVAFIARTTNPRYTATQFALLTSLAAVPRAVANASTGYLVEAFGWTQFFWICVIVAVPGLVMLWWIAPWSAGATVAPFAGTGDAAAAEAEAAGPPVRDADALD